MSRRLRTRQPDADQVQISIVLPADVFDAVRERAVDLTRSISGQITHMLRRQIEEEDDE